MNYSNFTINALVAANNSQHSPPVFKSHVVPTRNHTRKCGTNPINDLSPLRLSTTRPSTIQQELDQVNGPNQSIRPQLPGAHAFPANLGPLVRANSTNWPPNHQMLNGNGPGSFLNSLASAPKLLTDAYFHQPPPQLVNDLIGASSALLAARPDHPIDSYQLNLHQQPQFISSQPERLAQQHQPSPKSLLSNTSQFHRNSTQIDLSLGNSSAMVENNRHPSKESCDGSKQDPNEKSIDGENDDDDDDDDDDDEDEDEDDDEEEDEEEEEEQKGEVHKEVGLCKPNVTNIIYVTNQTTLHHTTTSQNYLKPSRPSRSTGKGKGNRKARLTTDGDIRRKFSCCHCGKSFKTKSHLQRHILTHTGEKPYHCNRCDCRFNQSSSLRNHVIAIHTKEYPHTCNNCSKGFLMPAVLQKHLQTSECGKLTNQVVEGL